ncbi:bifunctional hydroxymethylpyrimidine kinase/phosphomethylpyrimidine kinase [Limosilactobacillus caccae]|jgi:hydroxymethylpyrimidine/phosphomethylpyrimidine kinase|uniref:bifunctional hydroxymethylpyrimidine kinase/phosphomethylpyrimidine kinase n=1 Tax=Limosilactobacillus caccae TaxID=1926284 RepID=UPI0009708DF8|nr:bifunctional hydroxymethylpyrimidine kinase/phosphomethylpyrimidine kinase [Limosilactobacillus caccae]
MKKSTIQAVTIAGHDSDGSAGMPADLHAFFADGVYGHGILTAAVSGNSYGITASQVMPKEFIAEQFRVLREDFNIKAAKTGMLANDDVINAVADNYSSADFGPLVVDPVIITKHGAMLLEQSAYELFRKRIIPLAKVITPNFYEAQKLTGFTMDNREERVAAAHKLQKMGAKNVIIKGAHNSDDQASVDDFVLLEDGNSFWLSKPYVKTNRLNGTGDSFSAIIAAELAKGNDVKTAVTKAKNAVYAAIASPLTVGHKFGPINHWEAQKELTEGDL